MHSHPFICFECGTIASMWKSGHREDNGSFAGDQSCSLFELKKQAKTKQFGSSDKSKSWLALHFFFFASSILFVSRVLIMCNTVTVSNIQKTAGIVLMFSFYAK